MRNLIWNAEQETKSTSLIYEMKPTKIFYRRYKCTDYTVAVQAEHKYHPEVTLKWTCFKEGEYLLWNFFDAPRFMRNKSFRRWWSGVKEVFEAWMREGYCTKSRMLRIQGDDSYLLTFIYNTETPDLLDPVPFRRWFEWVLEKNRLEMGRGCTNNFQIFNLSHLLRHDPLLNSFFIPVPDIKEWFAKTWIQYLGYASGKKVHTSPFKYPSLRRILTQ